MTTSELGRTDEANGSGSSLSRRGFLILSTASAAVGVEETVGGASAETDGSDGPASLVLDSEDLPDPASYVQWSVDPTSAPLATALVDAVPGFDPSSGAASGFVATGDGDGPRSIESAVYPEVPARAAVAAADEWVEDVRSDPGARTIRHEPAPDVVQWETTYDDGVDVLRVDLLPGGTLAFTGASGTMSESRSVRRSVVRCADVTRDRTGPS